MAPEQVRGGAIDHRADIFAVGCILYELLAGRRAFQGDSSIDTMHATLHADPLDVATLAAVPEPLSRIVGHCLEKQPANRFQTATDLRFALDAIGDGSRTAAPAAQRRPLSMMQVTVATVVIAALAVGGWSWRASRGSEPSSLAMPHARGIAVLPFENLGEAGQAYFAAGVTEEVTLQLAKVSSLRVMSRAAVARFEDPATQLPDMARDLGVGAVLTGSVRHAGSQVRVGVQLLSAPSGESMWSEQYRAHDVEHLRRAERHRRPRHTRTAGVAGPGRASTHRARADREQRGIRALSAAEASVTRYPRAESTRHRQPAEGDRARSAVCAGLRGAGAAFCVQGRHLWTGRVPAWHRGRAARGAPRSAARARPLWVGQRAVGGGTGRRGPALDAAGHRARPELFRGHERPVVARTQCRPSRSVGVLGDACLAALPECAERVLPRLDCAGLLRR